MYVTSRSEQSEFRKRYRWMRVFVVLCFAVLIGRLVQLQLVEGGERSTKSQENIIRTVPIPAVRGRVFDNKGRVIATSSPSHSVVIIPDTFDMGDGFDRLTEYLGLDEEGRDKMRAKISERLANPKDMRRFQAVEVAEDITADQLAAIKSRQDELPGVEIIDVPVRYYPYGATAGQVIGFTNEVSGDDITKKAGTVEDPYRAGDRIGRSGLERSLEIDLRGVRGWRKKVVNARGYELPRSESAAHLPEPAIHEPRPGSDVILTIDMALQKIVEEALRGHPSGAAVVVEINSGRILAATSKPSYDPNRMTRGLTVEQNREIDENPFRPRIDKTVFENYFPGSTFKPFSAMAALEEGKITPDDVFHCSGFHELGRRTFRCPHAHGDITLQEALMMSCNCFFYNLAEVTGMDSIAKMARDFGFGSRTGIGYNSEAAGFIPTKAWYAEKFPGQFRIGHTLNTAIGQGEVKATVMQLALAYSAIANGGTLYKPQVVRRIETSEGDVVKEIHPEIQRRVAVQQHSLDLVMRALGDVVANEKGTAYSARNDKVSVAGKTGTAQVAKHFRQPGDDLARFYYINRDHAWFAAVAPAETPEVAITVLIEHGGAGGEYAAPVAIEIARRYYEEIAPRQEAPLIAGGTDKKSGEPIKRAKLPLAADADETIPARTHQR